MDITEYNIYSTHTYHLDEVLNSLGSSGNATLLVPDLQRNFVWTPDKIINLVDTLIKGWPFGLILSAEVTDNAYIFSPRPFYTRVALGWNRQRYDEFASDLQLFETATKSYRSAKYKLILEGQQRLQSLFLVFSQLARGITMDQLAWVDIFYNREKRYYRREGKRSPYAKLAVNLSSLCRAFSENDNIAKLDYSTANKSSILQWVFIDTTPLDGYWRLKEYLPPVLEYDENQQKFILISEFWNATDFEVLQKEIHLKTESVSATRAFWKLIQRLKQTPVPFLEIGSSKQAIDDEYNYMIIKVFTRLNAGGIKLSAEEITYSWIKRSWNKKTNNGTSAEDCLEKLRSFLNDRYSVPLRSDIFVKNLALLWSIFHNEGKRISEYDLLDGETLKSIAKWLSENWLFINQSIIDVMDLLQKGKILYGRQFFSERPIFLLSAWRLCGILWSITHHNQAVAETCLNGAVIDIQKNLARFIFLNQWADSFDRYPQIFAKMNRSVQCVISSDATREKLVSTFADSLIAIVDKAKKRINTIEVTTRNAVNAYKTYLWVWQRLTEERCEISDRLSIGKTGITAGEITIDHCVSVSFWLDLLNKNLDKYPMGSDKYNLALQKINSMGNCNILVRSLNSAKSDYQMKDLISQMDFDLMRFEETMKIPDVLVYPISSSSPDEILEAVEHRTSLMRNDLCDFVDGKITLQER